MYDARQTQKKSSPQAQIKIRIVKPVFRGHLNKPVKVSHMTWVSSSHRFLLQHGTYMGQHSEKISLECPYRNAPTRQVLL